MCDFNYALLKAVKNKYSSKKSVDFIRFKNCPHQSKKQKTNFEFSEGKLIIERKTANRFLFWDGLLPFSAQHHTRSQEKRKKRSAGEFWLMLLEIRFLGI